MSPRQGGSLVEWLSGKPVELGPGSTRWVSILAGWGMWLSHTKLVPSPERQGSRQGMALIIPHRAGTQQSLRGGKLKGQRSYWYGSGAAQEVGIPAGRGSGVAQEACIQVRHGSSRPTWS
jgi:hypothetical protein